MPRRVRGPMDNVVIQEFSDVDLVNAAGDVTLTGLRCPGDGARVLDWAIVISTAGDAAENHELTLEHGLAGAGFAVSAMVEVLANAAAQTVTQGDGMGADAPKTTLMGTQLQIQNVEGGPIANGAIIDGVIRWIL